MFRLDVVVAISRLVLDKVVSESVTQRACSLPHGRTTLLRQQDDVYNATACLKGSLLQVNEPSILQAAFHEMAKQRVQTEQLPC